VRKVIIEIKASAPIIFHPNLFETFPIGAEKFVSAIRSGANKFLSLSEGR